MARDVTFDRPLKAKLIVRLENGDEFEPTKEDLKHFGLIDPVDAYANFNRNLRKIVGAEDELCAGDLCTLRYFAERSILYAGHEGLGDFTCSDDDETLEKMTGVLTKLTWVDDE